MADFTTILNKGKKRFIDKYLKKRFFGRCEGCEERFDLLIQFYDKHEDYTWKLCHVCYDDLMRKEEED